MSRRTCTPKSDSGQSPNNMQVQNGLSFNGRAESAQVSPLLPPPPSSKRPVITDTGMTDYLSGEAYNYGRSSKTTERPLHPVSSHNNSNSSPIYDEPTPADVTEKLPSPPWDSPTAGNLPLPPVRHTQRQQFFEHQTSFGGNHCSSGSALSYDSMVGQTHNLALNSPTRTKPKQEDALFKDLVDFVRTRNSPSRANASTS